MEDNNVRLLGCQRKIRSFRANFEKLLAIVQYNKIQIMTASNFRIIDVLEGHSAGIRCIDVSSITKAVVSFSPGLLIVHAPFQGEGADNVVSLGTLRWKEYWRFDMKVMVRNLSLSQIGDFFAMSGDGFLTVWVRDSPVDFCYSQYIYQTRDDTKGVIARFLKQVPKMGFFIQQEVTVDGRLILLLEEKSTTLRILYQDKYQKPVDIDIKKDTRNDQNYRYPQRNPYGGGYMNRGGKDERIEISQESNPYANLLLGDENSNGFQGNQGGGELNYQQDELVEYQLPKHKFPIVYFKILHHDIFESEKRNLPNIIITLTSKNEVFLWQENLMTFTCVHSFKGYTMNTFFDAAFLELPPTNPKRYVELKVNVSKIFDSSKDKTLAIKKDHENNIFGIYKENYVETSNDWILVLTDQLIEIHKISGLRNFPQRQVKVSIFNRYNMNLDPRDFFGTCKIISASCRDFNDILSLYALNTSGQLVKLRKDIREEGKGKWKIDKVAILKREFIQDVIVHKQLPVIAHLMNNTEIYFYIEEKTKNRIVQESLTGGSMRFLGAYSVFQQIIKHNDPIAAQKLLKGQAHHQIVRAKWVNSPICQMIVQFNNDTLALISSQTQLRILSHSKYRDEYMKLWDGTDKGRNNMISEKWVELQQVHFSQGHGSKVNEVEEHIADFEIISSKILTEGSNIQINLAIFTTFNQYLVYETNLALQPGLKCVATTKMLYHVYTSDCVTELLSTVHFFGSDGNITHSHQGNMHTHNGVSSGIKTVMAIMSTVDPERQRSELAQKKREEVEARKRDAQKQAEMNQQSKNSMNDESEDEDDGDIFAQFTGGSSTKKNKDQLSLKKKQPEPQIEVPIVEEKPLQAGIVLKLIQFDEESDKKKECRELWRVDLPLDFQKKFIKCISSTKYFAFLLREQIPGQNGDQIMLYIYDLSATKYLGFINLTLSLSIPELHKLPLDLIFSQGSQKGSLTVFCRDTLYLIAESAREGQPGKWSVIRKIENVIGFDKRQDITHVHIQESFLKKQILIINKCVLSVQDKFIIKELQKTQDQDKAGSIIIKYPLHQIYTMSQKSYSIFDPKVLKELFIKGYVNMVVQILVRLMKTLSGSAQLLQVSEYLDMDIKNLMKDVQEHLQEIDSSQQQQSQTGKKKQETASSIFDDFYGGGFDSKPVQEKIKASDNNQKKQIDNSKQLEEEFEEGLPILIENLRYGNAAKSLGLRDEQLKAQFIEFLRRFKQIYKKEFFADNLTSMLLRDLYFETEDIGFNEEVKSSSTEAQDFNVQKFMLQLRSQPSVLLKGNIANIKQWTSLQTCLALHSEMQDVLINELQDRFDFESNLTYDIMKKLCIPIWIKDIPKLKAFMNIVAKNEYKNTSDDFGKGSRAEKTALWYILIDRKDQLTRLYKQEPAHKKVYDLLLNDFSLPKWKSTAEKNAIVLMSKKNHILACAFFLLAGNLNDALKVAIDKMNDAVLAVLIVRLFEKEPIVQAPAFDFDQESTTQTAQPQVKLSDQVYMEHFIKRGLRLEDPYLQNIGYWLRKEYVKAVNAFQIDPSKMSNIEYILNPSLSEFNVYFGSTLKQEERKLDALELIKKQKEDERKVVLPVPFNSAYSYHTLDFIKVLKKSTILKRALQQTTWDQPKYGASSAAGVSKFGLGMKKGFSIEDQEEEDDSGDESIFDDFFGGGGGASTTKKKKEEEKKKKEQEIAKSNTQDEGNKLIIEESKILEVVCSKTAITGYTLQALIIMAENTEYAEKASKYAKELVAETIIWDFMNSPSFQYPSLKKLQNSANYLVNLFKVDNHHIRDFILQQFVNLDNFMMQVSYMVEDHVEQGQKNEALQCVEDWALKIVDFVHSLVDFPFVLVQDAKGIEAVPYIIRKAVSYLEQLTESFIMVEMQIQSHQEKAKLQEVVVRDQSNKHKSPTQLVSMTIADAGGADNEGNYEFTVEEEKGNLKMKNLDFKSSKMINTNKLGLVLTDELEIAMQTQGSRTRISFIIYLGLLQVCLASRRYMLLREILIDLRTILFNNHDSQQKESQSIAIIMQHLKTQIQKLHQSLSQDVSQDKAPNAASDDNPYDFRQPEKPKTKEEIEEEAKARKINIFFEIWIEFCVSHNIVQVLRLAFEKTQIQSLIDQRPSIVQIRPINEAVEMIINPRLVTSDLLKRFVNKDRMLENVTTYYFENILNLNQRSIIASELYALQTNKFDASVAKLFQITKYFGSDKRFTDFATHLDLGTYVRHLRDHELSLIYHTNRDCSSHAIEKTQQLYENGIDIFRMRSEVVNAFAFDHCDLDLAALALMNKGIREIPVKKSLLYRTRHQKGHQVVDDELNSWYDCLHRFDRVAQEHQDIKGQSDSIVASIERLYQYKTINYTKKQRRSRAAFFLDYEMNPPDEWSGHQSSNFLKYKSDVEITHDDPTYTVESHPYLPLYFSGNTRGQVCMWKYNQTEDKNLDYWATEQGDLRSIDSKRSTIKKIAFNSYGDKLYCSNLEGNIYAFKIDQQDSSSHTVPIYSLRRGKEDKISDFDILSGDTVYAVTAQKPKHLWIYDALLNSRGGLVMESPLGGSILRPLRSRSQILLFNADKPGTLTILDLKMNRQLGTTLTLHTDEVTSVDLNEAENTLVAGFKDGIIKIFNISKSSGECEQRESYSAFSQVGNKKGGVSQVRIHPTNGALYAASTIGNFKLFRPRV